MRALTEQALRVFSRYQIEIVEGLRLCPWAERARLEGRTRPVVLPDPSPNRSAVLDAISELASDPRVEIGFIIFPRMEIDRVAFERYVADVGRADAARASGRGSFALAAFHPEATPDLSDPERLVPFVRRTPDPTIQLVRFSSLERVREGSNEGTQLVDIDILARRGVSAEETLPLRERIARSNLRIVERTGIDEVTRRLDDIRRDRDAAYAAIDAPQGTCPSS